MHMDSFVGTFSVNLLYEIDFDWSRESGTKQLLSTKSSSRHYRPKFQRKKVTVLASLESNLAVLPNKVVRRRKIKTNSLPRCFFFLQLPYKITVQVCHNPFREFFMKTQAKHLNYFVSRELTFVEHFENLRNFRKLSALRCRAERNLKTDATRSNLLLVTSGQTICSQSRRSVYFSGKLNWGPDSEVICNVVQMKWCK